MEESNRVVHAAPSAASKRSRALTGMAVVVAALLAATWAHREGLRNPYVVNPDVRQHTYWMESFVSPELFRDDPIAEYSRAYQPRAVVWLYRVLAPAVRPVTLSRLLPLFLLALAAWLAFRLAQHLGGAFAGVLAAAWLVLAPVFLHKMAGGHARAFAVPLLLAFLDALIRGKPWRTGGSLVLLALVYPMAFLVAGVGGCLEVVRRQVVSAEKRRSMAWAVVVGTLVGGFGLLAERAALEGERWGGLPTYDELVDRPELTAEGRIRVLPTPPFPQILGKELASVALPWSPLPRVAARRWRVAGMLAVGLVALLVAVALRGPRLPAALGSFAAAAFLLHGIAELVLLRLFLPQRYLEAPFRVLAVLAGALLVAGCVERFVPPARQRWVEAAILVWLALHLPALDGAGLEDRSAVRPIATYLGTTEVDALVAAHPTLADDIPLFARRRVLVDHEHAHPFYPRHWQWVRAETEAFFEAYYAERTEKVCSFLAEREVDHLVVDRRHFDPAAIAAGVYFEPFSSQIRRAVGTRPRFALLELGSDQMDFEAGDYAVTSADTLGCRNDPAPPNPQSM